MKMRPFGRLLPLESAVLRVLTAARPVRGVEAVEVGEALGRIAATSVRAPRNVPAFSRATWEGYALRARDTAGATAARPVRLRVIGEVFAEGALARPVRAGEAAAIATGGALPPGTDAVQIFEDVRLEDSSITLTRPVPVGHRVASPGDDFAKGAVLVRSGAVLDPAALGAVAATGENRVRVLRRPTVALIPNGNELITPGSAAHPGGIFEINNVTLGALASAAGALPRPVRPVRDDPGKIEAAIRRALRDSDLVVVTGGSSVGERDYLPAIFPRLGRLLFHGVAVRPGKPTLAAVANGKVLLGMPGHPTSCLANGFWLLLPLLYHLAGRPGVPWSDQRVRLVEPVPAPSPSLSSVVPLHVEQGRAHPTFRDSSAITSLSGANAFVILPPGAPRPRRGAAILVHRLAPPIAAT